MGFDRLMEDSTKKQWMIEEGKKLLSNMMKRAEKVQQYIYCFSLFNLHNVSMSFPLLSGKEVREQIAAFITNEDPKVFYVLEKVIAQTNNQPTMYGQYLKKNKENSDMLSTVRESIKTLKMLTDQITPSYIMPQYSKSQKNLNVEESDQQANDEEITESCKATYHP